jgi:beta-mannosidase
MTLRTGSELYRRNRNEYDPKTGTGLSSGSMYWQFNDLWQAPTWASIEYVSSPSNNFYGGKWKMAHYFIKRAYAQLLLSASINQPFISIYALSDLQTNYSSNFNLRIFKYDSLTPLYDENFKFSIESLSSKAVLAISFDELKSVSNCTIGSNTSCIILMESTDPQIQSNYLFLNNRLADVTNLKTPILIISNVVSLNSTAGLFQIQVKTDSPALFVWLDLETTKFTGTFSDNGFHMFENTKTITYQTDNTQVDLDDIKMYLSVKSLMNIYE